MYLYGESTLDEILFPILQFKNQICSNTLDGRRSDYHIKKSQDVVCNFDEEGIDNDDKVPKEGKMTPSTSHKEQ